MLALRQDRFQMRNKTESQDTKSSRSTALRSQEGSGAGLIEQGPQVAHDILVLAVAPPLAPMATSVDMHATILASCSLAVQTACGLRLKQEEVSYLVGHIIEPGCRILGQADHRLPRCRQGLSLLSLKKVRSPQRQLPMEMQRMTACSVST